MLIINNFNWRWQVFYVLDHQKYDTPKFSLCIFRSIEQAISLELFKKYPVVHDRDSTLQPWLSSEVVAYSVADQQNHCAQCVSELNRHEQ